MEAALVEAETEVRQPLVAIPTMIEDAESSPTAESTAPETEEPSAEEAPTPPATNQSVASILEELPTLDLTEDGPSRVSSRPWERG
jgi:hypothetical protein